RLGEDHATQLLVDRAKGWLSERGGTEHDVHVVLLEAFTFRIQQALQGKPAAGPLPAEVLEYAAQLAQDVRFKVDRLRMTSRILEPHHEVNAFRTYRAREFDNFQKALLQLQDIHDRESLEKEARRLLADAGSPRHGHFRRFKAVDAALREAPRIGEDFAREVLEQTPAACDAHDNLMEQAEMLERALVVAAHFNQAQAVEALLQRRGPGPSPAGRGAPSPLPRGPRKEGADRPGLHLHRHARPGAGRAGAARHRRTAGKAGARV